MYAYKVAVKPLQLPHAVNLVPEPAQNACKQGFNVRTPERFSHALVGVPRTRAISPGRSIEMGYEPDTPSACPCAGSSRVKAGPAARLLTLIRANTDPWLSILFPHAHRPDTEESCGSCSSVESCKDVGAENFCHRYRARQQRPRHGISIISRMAS